MKNQLLFCSLIVLMTACQQEADIQPNLSTLAGEVVGTYRTNFYLDPSYVAISSNQLPYAELKAESENQITLVYTTLYPVKTSQSIEHVTLLQQPDGIQLHVADSSIGTLQTDRIFTDNGMEKQGKLLRINIQSDPKNGLYFAGFK